MIHVDGTEEMHYSKPTLDSIHKVIECDIYDAVTLDHKKEIVMLVDDTGLYTKPINPKATALYRAICYPGTNGTIHGDVAIINDRDFE